MFRVMIAEKPSVAREYAKALKLNNEVKENGYIKGVSGVDGKDYRITWSFGHLITLSMPEKYDPSLSKWELETLPFLPPEYKYEVIKDVRAQFNVIKELYNSKDAEEILYAGDSGREGIYIQMLIREAAGRKRGVTEKVVWIDSQTESEILRGIKDAKPISDYQPLIDAAYMRGIEDYAIGINFSRVLGCKYGRYYNQKLNTSKYRKIAVGRVMTCVLGMIVNREREIRSFTETVFYRPVAAFDGGTAKWKAAEGTRYHNSPAVHNNEGFLQKHEAEEFISALGPECSLSVTGAETKPEKKNAPLLFNLAEIQNECSKKLHLSPKETLDIIQELYDAKIVTYPRTDARVLSTAIAAEIVKNLKGISKQGYHSEYAEQIIQSGAYKNLAKSRYCDDSKITDHYAIIPTGEGSTGSLSGDKKTVYQMIVDRFLSIFLPAAEYKKTDIVFYHGNNEYFYASEKVLTVPGYLGLYGEKAQSASSLAAIKKGDKVKATLSITEGKTTPPKRYTSGSMILAMENAGQLIEDDELREQIKSCGIGTSATRADIIKKLVDNGYISLDKKTQVLKPAEPGEVLYDIVSENMPALLSPQMTASWEKGLSQIEQGLVTKDIFLRKLNSYVEKEVEAVKQKEVQNAWQEEIIGKCPLCGEDVINAKNGYKCRNYKSEENPCSFYIGITDKYQVQKLLTEGRTDVIEMTNKKGERFKAAVVMDPVTKERSMEFPDNTAGVCPFCGGRLIEGKTGIRCENFKSETSPCSFFFSSTNRKELENLLNSKRTGLMTLTSKEGKKYKAYFVLDAENKRIDREFEQRHTSGKPQEKEPTDFECPKCGELMKRGMWNLECPCGVKISHSICGISLDDNQIKSLLAGRTGIIDGFTSKKGNKFSAALVLNNYKTEFLFPDKS